MNNSIKMFLLLVVTTTLLAGFQCCKKFSCCDHDTVTTTKQTTQPSAHPMETVIRKIETSEEFEELITQPTVIKFTTNWCTACKAVEPLYRRLAAELHESYQFASVDISQHPSLADKYKIRGIPAFLFFDKNKQLPGQIIGADITHDEFVKKINDIFK